MSDPREQRMNQLLLRGHATVAEIMRADFGEWPPNGVELAVEPKQDVKLLSMWRACNKTQLERSEKLGAEKKGKKSRRILPGFIIRGIIKAGLTMMASGAILGKRIEPVRTIYLNSFLSYSRASTTGHEATHIMQTDHAKTLKDAEYKSISDEITLGFWKTAKRQSFAKRTWERVQGKHNEKEQKEESAAYYQRGREIQARMHQILAAGYSKWGCVPTTKEELWAALIGGGVKPPEEVMRALQQSPSGKAALEKFITVRNLSQIWDDVKNSAKLAFALGGSAFAITTITGVTGAVSLPMALLLWGKMVAMLGVSTAVCTGLYSTTQEAAHKFSGLSAGRDISGIQKKINTGENKVAFWDSVLPQVYGDLLEMYGDTQGRARMGLGHNEKLIGSWLNLLREDHGVYDHGDFQRWAKAIGKEKAAEALQTITQSAEEERKPNDAAIIQAIAEQYGVDAVKLENPPEKLDARNSIPPAHTGDVVLEAVKEDFPHTATSNWAEQLPRHGSKFSEAYVTSLKNFLEEFEQTKRYECLPSEPNNVQTGFTFWLPPTSDKVVREKALTVTPEKITIHASNKDAVLVDSIRMAVQMFGGNFQVKNASPELLDKIKLMTKDMMAASDVLVDCKGNKVTQVTINGDTIAPVHDSASMPYRGTFGSKPPRAQEAMTSTHG